MLRSVRIIVSSLCFAVVTLLFIFPGSALLAHFSKISAIQWLPAAMAFSLPICIGWLVFTLFFGRIYCSSVCPLGTLMDVTHRIKRGRKSRLDPMVVFHYSLPRTFLANIILTLTFVSLIFGIDALALILDPYSAYGRMCNSILGVTDDTFSSHSFFVMCIIAIATFIGVALLAWRNGRLWCNTICPVGKTLGYVSKHALFKVDIDTDLCTQCRECEWVCKAECIDLTSHVVDGSRCVNCFNCVDVCRYNAIKYTSSRKQLSLPMLEKAQAQKTAMHISNQK